MNIQNTARKWPANDILSCYLDEYYPEEKSETSQYFDVYKKCISYEKTIKFGYGELDELVELGLPNYLEARLENQIDKKNNTLINKELANVQEKMSKAVELSREYKNYKKILLGIYKKKPFYYW